MTKLRQWGKPQSLFCHQMCCSVAWLSSASVLPLPLPLTLFTATDTDTTAPDTSRCKKNATHLHLRVLKQESRWLQLPSRSSVQGNSTFLQPKHHTDTTTPTVSQTQQPVTAPCRDITTSESSTPPHAPCFHAAADTPQATTQPDTLLRSHPHSRPVAATASGCLH
jgi:hypothetical protein